MKKFIKDNFVLVVGITLPVLLVIVFALASYIPKQIVAPPQYDFISANNYYEGSTQNTIRFSIVEGKLIVESRNIDSKYVGTIPKLYVFEHQNLRTKEITFKIPSGHGAETGVWERVDIPELTNVKIDTSVKAPDGYEFRQLDNYRGGFLGLFSYRGYKSNVVISKSGRSISVKYGAQKNYYNQPHFLGWIKHEK